MSLPEHNKRRGSLNPGAVRSRRLAELLNDPLKIPTTYIPTMVTKHATILITSVSGSTRDQNAKNWFIIKPVAMAWTNIPNTTGPRKGTGCCCGKDVNDGGGGAESDDDDDMVGYQRDDAARNLRALTTRDGLLCKIFIVLVSRRRFPASQDLQRTWTFRFRTGVEIGLRIGGNGRIDRWDGSKAKSTSTVDDFTAPVTERIVHTSSPYSSSTL